MRKIARTRNTLKQIPVIASIVLFLFICYFFGFTASLYTQYYNTRFRISWKVCNIERQLIMKRRTISSSYDIHVLSSNNATPSVPSYQLIILWWWNEEDCKNAKHVKTNSSNCVRRSFSVHMLLFWIYGIIVQTIFPSTFKYYPHET